MLDRQVMRLFLWYPRSVHSGEWLIKGLAYQCAGLAQFEGRALFARPFFMEEGMTREGEWG
jgi:hypothetical protein